MYKLSFRGSKLFPQSKLIRINAFPLSNVAKRAATRELKCL